VVGGRLVSVVAPSGMIADGLATAIYVSRDLTLATANGARAFEVGDAGRRRWSRGARRDFR
jgi:thiamine biosynthesis lipoprotein ApbE